MKQHSLASLGLHPSTAAVHTHGLSCRASPYALRDSRVPLPCHVQLQNICVETSCSPQLSRHALLTRDGLRPESEGAFPTAPQQRPAWVVWVRWPDSPQLLASHVQHLPSLLHPELFSITGDYQLTKSPWQPVSGELEKL